MWVSTDTFDRSYEGRNLYREDRLPSRGPDLGVREGRVVSKSDYGFFIEVEIDEAPQQAYISYADSPYPLNIMFKKGIRAGDRLSVNPYFGTMGHRENQLRARLVHDQSTLESLYLTRIERTQFSVYKNAVTICQKTPARPKKAEVGES